MEKLSQGNGRCLKQESAQTLIWLRHPETRFTFDHIGCENLSQVHLEFFYSVNVACKCVLFWFLSLELLSLAKWKYSQSLASLIVFNFEI
jgi:hypothetical protein